MKSQDLTLQGIKLLTPQIFFDHRGFFFESFHEERFRELGIPTHFVQDNQSYSKKGTIRGMHFQKGRGQAKLVSVAVGKIYDVVVDIRRDSPTFGQWMGVELDDQKRQILFVPEGFAHGFCALSDIAHVQYKVSTFYDPKIECGFSYCDKEMGIIWPEDHPILSEKDANSPLFSEVI